MLRGLEAPGDADAHSRGYGRPGVPWAYRRVCALVAQPVKEVFHLVAPELALVLDLDLAAGEIFDD